MSSDADADGVGDLEDDAPDSPLEDVADPSEVERRLRAIARFAPDELSSLVIRVRSALCSLSIALLSSI
jgi:hypothetical protein